MHSNLKKVEVNLDPFVSEMDENEVFFIENFKLKPVYWMYLKIIIMKQGTTRG